MKALTEVRDKLSAEYRDNDFRDNPNGYTVASYVNRDTTSTAFEMGFDKGAELAALEERKRAQVLVDALKKEIEAYDCAQVTGGFNIDYLRRALAAYEKETAG